MRPTDQNSDQRTIASRRTFHRQVMAGSIIVMGAKTSTAVELPQVSFRLETGRVEVLANERPLATYIYEDPAIPRPHWAHVRVPGGPQLTRNHPPQPGDATDHDQFHPGVWWAFGDLSGHDCWRLKANVRAGGFASPPRTVPGGGTFAVRNEYLTTDGKQVVLGETCSYGIWPQTWGCLWTIDTTFTAASAPCRFGDQMEEMGLGVRVATPLAVKSGRGARILDSEGRVNEKAIREQLADWCDYAGPLEGQHAGVLLMAHPQNSRRTWWHVRDYGFFTANPFHADRDRKQNEALTLAPGESVRFRYGLAWHRTAGDHQFVPADVFATYARDH